MAIQFMGLPQLSASGPNGQIDFSPLARAFQGYTQAQDRLYQSRKIDESERIKKMGTLAQMVDQEQDPTRRQQLWNAHLERVRRLGKSDFAPEELDPMTGPKLMMAEAGIAGEDPLDRQLKLSQINRNNRSSDQESAAKYSLNPIYGVDDKGNPVVMQPGSHGDAIRTRLPEGVTVSNKPIKIDAGTEVILIDPITRQPVGRIPKDVAGTEGQKVEGRETAELKFAMPKAKAAMDSANAKAEIVRSKIAQAKSLVGPWTAGPGSLLASIPGSAARDLREAINTIVANLGFDELQEMRANSPTGGALGQVAVMELEMLQKTKSSLDTAQSVGQLMQALQEIEAFYQGAAGRRLKAFDETYRRVAPQTPPPAATSTDLKKKYGLE